MIETREEALRYIENVIDATAIVMSTPRDIITSNCRKGPLVKARYTAALIIRENTKHLNAHHKGCDVSLGTIGRALGGLNYATMVYGLRKADLGIRGDGKVPPYQDWRDLYDAISRHVMLLQTDSHRHLEPIFEGTDGGYTRAISFLTRMGEDLKERNDRFLVIYRANRLINTFR